MQPKCDKEETKQNMADKEGKVISNDDSGCDVVGFFNNNSHLVKQWIKYLFANTFMFRCYQYQIISIHLKEDSLDSQIFKMFMQTIKIIREKGKYPMIQYVKKYNNSYADDEALSS